MARLGDFLPSKHFEDRTNIPRQPDWRNGGIGQDVPREFLELQHRWVAESGKAITEDENAALWEAYQQGRLGNFLQAYRDLGQPPLLTPNKR